MNSKLYRLLFMTVLPYLPKFAWCQYIKWKLAILLVGDEFHKVNLDNNRETLARHFSHSTRLQDELASLITRGGKVRILDVGAGPVSKVGKLMEGTSIEIVPVDPLADNYRKILESLQLNPKFWTIKGYGESLSKQFEAGSFDLAHARNSLDHCLNPLAVIKETLKVLKSGCYFYMNHFRNEGDAADYYGLHQWNFDCDGSDFFISSRFGEQINVNEELKDIARVHSVLSQEDRLIVVVQKL